MSESKESNRSLVPLPLNNDAVASPQPTSKSKNSQQQPAMIANTTPSASILNAHPPPAGVGTTTASYAKTSIYNTIHNNQNIAKGTKSAKRKLDVSYTSSTNMKPTVTSNNNNNTIGNKSKKPFQKPPKIPQKKTPLLSSPPSLLSSSAAGTMKNNIHSMHGLLKTSSTPDTSINISENTNTIDDTHQSATNSNSTTPNANGSNHPGGNKSTNEYDQMLGEISNLLQAASEAQALGRLKMSSTYQLLAHARLIGLGRRFDRVLIQNGINTKQQQPISTQQPQGQNHPMSLKPEMSSPMTTASTTTATTATGVGRSLVFPPLSNTTSYAKTKSINNNDVCSDSHPPSSPIASINNNWNTKQLNSVATPPSSLMLNPNTNTSHTTPTPTTTTTTTTTTPKIGQEQVQEAQAALAKILPNDINLDTTMMEHLARAAMELHNIRTGRNKRLIHDIRTGASPQTPSSLTSTIHTNTTTTTTTTTTAPNNNSMGMSSGVAWSIEEKNRLLQAKSKFGDDNIDDIVAAVKTRSVAEVKAHLKNVCGRQRVERELFHKTKKNNNKNDDDDNEDEDNLGNKGRSNSNVKEEDHDDDDDDDIDNDDEDDDDDVDHDKNSNQTSGTNTASTPTKRRGKGKKPRETTAMLTDNADMDARSILGGKTLL